MNKLPISKRVQIVNLLVEGNSLRATSRIADVSINTVTKLLVDVGTACQEFHDNMVTNLNSRRVQCDEIWSYVYAKQKNVPPGMELVAGDMWTWVAIDADTKLTISWLVGEHNTSCATMFMQDVAARLKRRVQLTTDGLKCYLDAIEEAFEGQLDYGQLIKVYADSGGGSGDSGEKKYSSSECIGVKRTPIIGNPDEKHISTSFVERQNLTMRMHMRRFTRLTNGFSKKIDNHCHAVALHFVYYNFAKIHKTLRVTPAMEAGLIDRWMEIEDIVKLAD